MGRAARGNPRRRQPSRRAVARKHIEDGPKGAASGARARQSTALRGVVCQPRACPGAWFDECARRVEAERAFEFGTLNGDPEELKAALETGSIVAVAETLSGEFHP